MRVLIFTHGSRGDVQPFVALASKLEMAGHEAVLCAPASACELVENHGVRFFPLYDRWPELTSDPVIRLAFETNYGGWRGKWLAVEVARRFRPMMQRVLGDMAVAADVYRSDVVVYQPNVPGRYIAEYLGVPAVVACLQPAWVPTASFPSPVVPVSLPSFLNFFSYRLAHLWVRSLTGSTRRWRVERLGLDTRGCRRSPDWRLDRGYATVIQAVSTELMAIPHDYGAHVHTTGFWFLPGGGKSRPPEQVVKFLASAERPVCIGFGSLVSTRPERLRDLVRDAVAEAGVRAIVVKGWGGIGGDEQTESLTFVEEVSFDWLFPQVSVVVHHGGVGTTAMALASGRPQVICPSMVEQPYIGTLVHSLGVSPEPLPQIRLTVETLANALSEATSDVHMAMRADKIGRRVREEDGVGAAVEIIEAHAEARGY